MSPNRNVTKQLEDYIQTAGFGYWRDLYRTLPAHVANLRNCEETSRDAAVAELRHLLGRCGQKQRRKIAGEAGLDPENPDNAIETVRCLGRLCASALAAIALRQASTKTADAAQMKAAWELLVEAWEAWRHSEAAPAGLDYAPALEGQPPQWQPGASAATLWDASSLGLELAFQRWAGARQRPDFSVRTPVVLLNPKNAEYDEQVEIFIELYEHRDPMRRLREGLWLNPEQPLWPLSGDFVKTVVDLQAAIAPGTTCMWGIRSHSELTAGFDGKSHGAGVAALFDALMGREEVDPSVPVFGAAEVSASKPDLQRLPEDVERRKIAFAVRNSIDRVVVIRSEPEPSRFQQGVHILCADSLRAVRAALRHDLVREGYLRWIVQWSSQTKVEVKKNGASWYAPLRHVYSVPEYRWGQGEEISLHRNPDAAGWLEPQADVNQARSSPRNGASSLAALEAASVILGDPGTGKSMLLYWLAQQHARTALQTGLKSVVRVGGDLCGEDAAAAGLNLGPARLPIFVSLQGYPEWLERADGAAKTLDAWLYTAPGPTLSGIPRYPDLHPRQGGAISPADLRKLIEHALDRGECLILLDGLDELALVEMRAEVKSLVETFITARQSAGNRIVLTSRRVGYEAAPLASSVPHTLYLLRELQRAQAARFLADWSRVYCEAHPEWDPPGSAESRASRLAVQLAARLLEDLSDLAQTPLLLALLAKMFVEQGGLPGSRLELYEKLVEQHLDLRRDAFEALPELPLSCLDLLSSVIAGLRARTTSPMFAVESWNDLCDSVLQEHGVRSRKHRTSWASALREQGGLLVHSGTDHLAFAHQSFGEFLAGRGLFLGPPQQVLQQLEIRMADPFWREALTLGLAWCSKRRTEKDYREILTALLTPDPRVRLVESGALLATEAFRAAGGGQPWAIRMTASSLASAWSALEPDERARALARTYLEALRKLEELRAGTVEEIALDWLSRQSAPDAANAAELCKHLNVVSDAVANAVFRAAGFDNPATGLALPRALRRLLSLNEERPASVRGLRLRQFLTDNKEACARLMASSELLRAVVTLYGGLRDEGAFEAWNRYRERQAESMRGVLNGNDKAVFDALMAHTARGAAFSHLWIYRESPLTDLVMEALGHTDAAGWFRTACELLVSEQKAAPPQAELWRTVGRLWSAAGESGRCKLQGHALAALVALDGWSPELQQRIDAACKEEPVKHCFYTALTMARQDLQEAAIRNYQKIETQLSMAGRNDGVAFEAAVLSLLWIGRELDLPVPSPASLWESLSEEEKGGRIGTLVTAWTAWHAIGGIPPLDLEKSKHLAAGVIYALAATWDKCFGGMDASAPGPFFALNKLFWLPVWCNRFGPTGIRMVFNERDAIREAAKLLPVFRNQNSFLFYLAIHYLIKGAWYSGADIRPDLERCFRYVAGEDVAELRRLEEVFDRVTPVQPVPEKDAALERALDAAIAQRNPGLFEAGRTAFRAVREISHANTPDDAATLIWGASQVPMPILVHLYNKLVAELVAWGKLAPERVDVAFQMLDLIWACRQLRREDKPDIGIIRLRPDFAARWSMFASGLATPSLKTLAMGQHGHAIEVLGLNPFVPLAGHVCDAIDNLRMPGTNPDLDSLWARWPADANCRDALLLHAMPEGLTLTFAAAAALDRAFLLPDSGNSAVEIAAWVFRVEPELMDWVRVRAQTGSAELRDFAALLLAETGEWSTEILDSLRHLIGNPHELLAGRAYLALSAIFSYEQPLGRSQAAVFEAGAAACWKAATPAMINIWVWFTEHFQLTDPELLRTWIAASSPGDAGETSRRVLRRIWRLDRSCLEVVKSSLRSALPSDPALAIALLRMIRNVIDRDLGERKFWTVELHEEILSALDIPALQPAILRIAGRSAEMRFVPKLRELSPDASAAILLDQALGRVIAEAGSDEEKTSEAERLWHQLSIQRSTPKSCIGLLTSYLRIRGATVAEALRLFGEGWDALYVCAALISQDDANLWSEAYRESVRIAGEFLHNARPADKDGINVVLAYIASLISEAGKEDDPPPHRQLDRWLQTLAEFAWRSPNILEDSLAKSCFPWRVRLMEVTRSHAHFTARQSAIKLVARTRLLDSEAVQALTSALLDVHHVAEEARQAVSLFSRADSGGVEGLEAMLLHPSPRICLTAAELLMALAADPTLNEDERRERRTRAERLVLERLSKASPREWVFYIPRYNGQEKRFQVRPEPFAPLRSALRNAIVKHEGWVKQDVTS